jgi:hypothetical protein
LADFEGVGTVAAVLRGLIELRTAVLSAATIVAAFGLSGCSEDAATPPPPPPPSATAATTSQPALLPDPAALTDVLMKLSDPAIPGPDKLPLVEGATPAEAATLDGFAKALADNHMLPMTFAATDLTWSEKSRGNVRATVTATPGKPGSGTFTFPMEFTPTEVGWQLSRQTADQLLAFGTSQTDNPVPSDSPTTTPTR